MPIAIVVLALLTIVNIQTFFRYRQDKRRAVAGGRRIPERDLLGLAVIGGTPAAFLARRLFRHKTRKEPFSTFLKLIACLQAGALIGWFVL